MTSGRTLPIQAETGTITFSISADGKELPQTYEIISIVTHKEVNRIPFARLVLKDGDAAKEDFELSSAATLIPGKKIEISAGYDSQNKTLFKGIIVKHGIKISTGGFSTLHIECRDESIKMTVGRHSNYFAEMKDSEVMEKLVKAYGLKAKVEATNIKHAELVQYYCTDWDFLISRAEMNGQLVHVSDGEITVKAPKMSGSTLISLLYGDTIYEFEAEMDARHQFKSVNSQAWDYSKQELTETEGSKPEANGLGNLKENDLANVIGLAKLDFRHSGHRVNTELKEWASSQLVKSHLAKVIGRAKFQGFPGLELGNLVELNGLGDRFNGKGYLTAIRHELIDGQWYTHVQFGRSPEWFYEEFEAKDRSASGLLPGVNGLQIGIVTKLENDPNGEFRIQVRLPLVNNANEGTWARLASLDAGDNRGWVIRPEIGDEVIIGFINDDPRDPIVLGMLHSSKKPAPIAAKDDNHEKGLVTRSKMRLHFDDDKKIMTLETPAGNKIVLDEDGKDILITDQNSNKVTLDSNGITLESSKDIILKASGEISLKASGDIKAEGVNIQHKAQAQFKAEGAAGLEVSTSAIATVKGSLVKIN
jgi:Rhs element Vgr protein